MLIFSLVSILTLVVCLYREYRRADLCYGDMEYKPLIHNAADHTKKLKTSAAFDYLVSAVLIGLTGALAL